MKRPPTRPVPMFLRPRPTLLDQLRGAWDVLVEDAERHLTDRQAASAS